MITSNDFWEKLATGRDYRKEIVASMLKQGTALQIQGMMKEKEWTQAQLAQQAGLTQGVISRASNPAYGNLTFNTVIDIAAGFDVAFIGKFVPFSEFSRWAARLEYEIAFDVSDFEVENKAKMAASQMLADATPLARLRADTVATGEQFREKQRQLGEAKTGKFLASSNSTLPASSPTPEITSPTGEQLDLYGFTVSEVSEKRTRRPSRFPRRQTRQPRRNLERVAHGR
jgi:hypothetical protein